MRMEQVSNIPDAIRHSMVLTSRSVSADSRSAYMLQSHDRTRKWTMALQPSAELVSYRALQAPEQFHFHQPGKVLGSRQLLQQFGIGQLEERASTPHHISINVMRNLHDRSVTNCLDPWIYKYGTDCNVSGFC